MLCPVPDSGRGLKIQKSIEKTIQFLQCIIVAIFIRIKEIFRNKIEEKFNQEFYEYYKDKPMNL